MSELNQRSVKMEDAELIFMWSNDEDVRKNSFTSHKIEWEDHLKWMEKTLIDPFVIFQLICVDQKPVGMYRIQIIENQGLISYSIAKEYRGLGYGKSCIQMLVQQIFETYPQIEELVAYTKPENISSRRIFLSVGFTEQTQATQNRYFKKKEGHL